MGIAKELMFETESNWSIFNQNLVDYLKNDMPQINELSNECVSCGNHSNDPSNDHFVYTNNMLLCELCFLDYQIMTNN